MTEDEIIALVEATVKRVLRGRLISKEQHARQIARARATMAVHRGTLARKPCEQCGEPDAERHHADYSRPLDVTWLCRRCHRALHRAEQPAPPGKRPCLQCRRPTKGNFCTGCRVRKHRGAVVAGDACKVCGDDDARLLRRQRFTDQIVVLCANHAALKGRRTISWADFLAELR